MYIKHWDCWMWGFRRLDTRLAIDFGKHTLYIKGFPYRDISMQSSD